MADQTTKEIALPAETPFSWRLLARLGHMYTVIVLSYKVIADYSTGKIGQQLAVLSSLAGLISILTGMLNTFWLLRPKAMPKPRRKLWVGYHHLKLLSFILLMTPANHLIKGWLGDGALINLRMGWLVAIIGISAYMRLYREKHSIAAPKSDKHN